MFLNSLMFCFHRLCFILSSRSILSAFHDDVIKWKHFPRNWPFVREIHRSPVNFPHKGQWRGALMFSLIYPWINDWVNNREAGDLRRQHGHYDVIVMYSPSSRAFAIIFSKSLQWCLWRLKSPASRFFAQPFVQAQVREKISRLRGTGLSEGNPSDQWIPLKKGQLCAKCCAIALLPRRLSNLKAIPDFAASKPWWILTHWGRGATPSLVHIMACCLFGTKPLSKPMLVYCQLDNYFIRNLSKNRTNCIQENQAENFAC